MDYEINIARQAHPGHRPQHWSRVILPAHTEADARLQFEEFQKRFSGEEWTLSLYAYEARSGRIIKEG